MGTCKECRHWAGPNVTDYGICKHEEAIEDKFPEFWAAPLDRAVPYDGGWLATGPDFYCPHFSPVAVSMTVPVPITREALKTCEIHGIFHPDATRAEVEAHVKEQLDAYYGAIPPAAE